MAAIFVQFGHVGGKWPQVKGQLVIFL